MPALFPKHLERSRLEKGNKNNFGNLSFEKKQNIYRTFGQIWWHMPLIPGQRQADFCELEARLVYVVSSSYLKLPGEILSQKNKLKVYGISM